MISKFFQLGRLPKGALLLTVVSLANVILGFSREATIAYFFGATAELDTFLVALSLPRIIVVNAVQITVAVVLPIYVGYRSAGKREEATELVRRWFWYTGKILAALCALLFVAAEPLMHLLAPGFSAEQTAEAAFWLRALLPFLWFLSAAGSFKVVLDTNRKFGAPQSAAGVLSLSVIASCIAFASNLGVAAIALGFVGGGLLGFTIQLLRVIPLESIRLTRKSKAEVQLPYLAGGALILQTAALHAGIVIDRAFASTLPEGSIAALNFADSINSVPMAVVNSALATALFPILSEMAARNEWQRAFRASLKWYCFVALLAAGPMIGLIVFREALVTLLFKRGHFDANAVDLTASVLAVLPLLFLFRGGTLLFERFLLANRLTTTLVIIAITTMIIKLTLSFLLVKPLGLVGLALATVITAFLATLICLVVSYRYSRQGDSH